MDHRASRVVKTLDPDFLCAVCGAGSELQVWELFDGGSLEPYDRMTVRGCSVDRRHTDVVLRSSRDAAPGRPADPWQAPRSSARPRDTGDDFRPGQGR